MGFLKKIFFVSQNRKRRKKLMGLFHCLWSSWSMILNVSYEKFSYFFYLAKFTVTLLPEQFTILETYVTTSQNSIMLALATLLPKFKRTNWPEEHVLLLHILIHKHGLLLVRVTIWLLLLFFFVLLCLGGDCCWLNLFSDQLKQSLSILLFLS